MSDTAIFIAATADDLKANNGLPADLSALLGLISDTERIVHTEMIADAAMPERFVNTLSQSGAQVTVLPATPDGAAALTTGLTARLHEFICSFPAVNQFLLAGIQVDRLSLAAAYLQRAGFQVLLAGPDRAALERVGVYADDTLIWGKGGSSPARRPSSRSQQSQPEKDDSSDTPDPFEVLVEEVTKSRNRGNRVLLTSLKQRMRKRIRRFDETRLKDKDGRPMRKFKDFVVDAANRGLIQLIERGNASQVLLPGEEINTADEDEDETAARSGRGEKDDNDDIEVDPLLDSVDMVGQESDPSEDDEDNDTDTGDDKDDDSSAENEREPEPPEEPLTADDIDPEEIDEEANPPPVQFLELIESILKTPQTLEDLVAALVKKQQDGELSLKKRTLRNHLQAAFNNELLETQGDEKPMKYSLVDDWRDIIDYL